MSLYPFRKVIKEFLILNRHYSNNHLKKIRPVKIKSDVKPQNTEEDFLQDPNIRKNVWEEVKYSDMVAEPNMETFDVAYEQHVRELESLKFKMKSEKMIRKHFKEFIPKELNLLTFAEKEHIRYLCNTDPENWSPETIAESFPVSPEGAKKIIDSTFRAKSFEEATDHDKAIAKKIRLIKQGVIKLTPELRRKMEIRDKIPFKIGAAQRYGHFISKSLTVQENRLGEFESLVATSPISKITFYKDNCYPSVNPRKASTEEERELFSRHDDRDRSEEFEDLKVSKNKLMTLDELESQVSKSRKNDTTKTSSDAELDYLLRLDDKTLLNDKIMKESGDMCSAEEVYHPHTLCRKYKEPDEEEGPYGEASNVSQTNSNSYSRNSIIIPPELKKEGAIYKVGNSYYDEEGEFLYKVV